MSAELNTDHTVLWFDDLGTGNEEYRFLSNFYEGDPIVLPGVNWRGTYDRDHTYVAHASPEDETPVEFATGEHAFQAMKCRYIGQGIEFYSVATAPTPSEAKAIGRRVLLREDWEFVKYDVMAAVVRAKFPHGSALGQRLLDTGDKILVEGTWWGDDVWGVDLKKADLPGRNWLGTLLMARRAELRSGMFHDTGLWNSLFTL